MFKTVFLSLILLIALAACGPQNKKVDGFTPRPNGGQFTGGGTTENTPNPTEDGSEDTGGGDPRGSKEKYLVSILLDKVRLEEELKEILLGLQNTEYKFVIKNIEFLTKWMNQYMKSEIILTKTLNNIVLSNVCVDKKGHIKSAAVEDFDINAKICVSKKALSEIPAESLRKQVHLLLLHEISHLIGFRETDANKMQDLVLANYDQLFREDNAKSQIKDIFIRSVLQTKRFFKEIINLPDVDFASGEFLGGQYYKEKYRLKSELIFPMLVNSGDALLSLLEKQAEENPNMNSKDVKKELKKIIHIPYSIDNIFSIAWEDKFGSKMMGIKPPNPNGNYLYLKDEYKKALDILENAKIINDDFHTVLIEKIMPPPVAP